MEEGSLQYKRTNRCYPGPPVAWTALPGALLPARSQTQKSTDCTISFA